MGFRCRWRLLVAFVVGGAMFGMASVVQASIPDASGVIHGCYNAAGAKSVGGSALNVIDTGSASCSRGQQPIAWNQMGPPGATGPTGPTGPRGPSDAWDASTSSVDVPSNGASVVVVSVSLPAGSFFVEGRATIVGNDGYTCTLNGPSGTLDSATMLASALGTESVQSTVSLSSADTVSVKCQSVNGYQGTASAHIDAVEVGTLH